MFQIYVGLFEPSILDYVAVLCRIMLQVGVGLCSSSVGLCGGSVSDYVAGLYWVM